MAHRPNPGGGIGRAGFICGTVSVVTPWIPIAVVIAIGIIAGILGIGLSSQARREARRGWGGSYGLAGLGLALSIIGIVTVVFVGMIHYQI